MGKISVSEQEIRSMEDYLKGYAFHQKMLGAEKYEQQFFYEREEKSQKKQLGEIPLAQIKMFEVRHFIMGLANGDEKLLLYYHYVKGDSIERCSELLGIGRSTAFRMKKRALALAALHKKSEETIDGVINL